MGACAPSRNTRPWSRRCCRRCPRRRSPLADAHGRVLARDVAAAVALPGFDNSAMDGYAARWADVATAAQSPVRLPVADDIPAGRTDVVPLAPGHRAADHDRRPAAGRRRRRRPGGADRRRHRGRRDPRRPARRQPPAGGRRGHRRRRGRADRRHRRSAPRSSAWRPPSASPRCPVRRRPRVLVLSTGSELVEPGQPLLPGQIYESNSHAARRRGRGGRRRRPAGCTSSPTTSTQFLATRRATS